tara:strand:+ start:347 stop:763 length:417 start_codon:yes stop_codon:yes gene_type:complete
MKIVDALARLERAGQEHSRTTQKLRNAAVVLAAHVCTIVPEGVGLPRGYRVARLRSNVDSELFLEAPWRSDEWEESAPLLNATGGYLHGDFSMPLPIVTRDDVLRFAGDVAGGWLTELAEWLERRCDTAQAAAKVLHQ